MLKPPEFCIDLNRIRENAARFKTYSEQAFPDKNVKIFFAVKSHPSLTVLKILQQQGIGCEAMTRKELAWARSLSMPTIVSGYVKPQDVLMAALDSDYLVVETEQEIPRLLDLTRAAKHKPSIAIRVKVTPDSKPGCSPEAIAEIAGRTELHIRGIHFHLGWNMKDDDFVEQSLCNMAAARDQLRKLGRPVRMMNFGGSFCEYSSDPEQLARRLAIYGKLVDDSIDEVHFEPGRYFVGDAGTLSCGIQYVDHQRKIVVVNTCAYGYRFTGATPSVRLAGVNTLQEPDIWNVHGFWPTNSDKLDRIGLVGQPHCGDTLLFENMGAYVLGLESQFALEAPAAVIYS